MLKVGQQAPAFELPDSGMEMVSLSRYKGKSKVVLFFYPRDSMPQCREEAINFSDREEDFLSHGAVVMGVSQDDILCHADFCEATASIRCCCPTWKVKCAAATACFTKRKWVGTCAPVWIG